MNDNHKSYLMAQIDLHNKGISHIDELRNQGNLDNETHYLNLSSEDITTEGIK